MYAEKGTNTAQMKAAEDRLFKFLYVGEDPKPHGWFCTPKRKWAVGLCLSRHPGLAVIVPCCSPMRGAFVETLQANDVFLPLLVFVTSYPRRAAV